jgi:hypothetical protein
MTLENHSIFAIVKPRGQFELSKYKFKKSFYFALDLCITSRVH